MAAMFLSAVSTLCLALHFIESIRFLPKPKPKPKPKADPLSSAPPTLSSALPIPKPKSHTSSVPINFFMNLDPSHFIFSTPSFSPFFIFLHYCSLPNFPSSSSSYCSYFCFFLSGVASSLRILPSIIGQLHTLLRQFLVCMYKNFPLFFFYLVGLEGCSNSSLLFGSLICWD